MPDKRQGLAVGFVGTRQGASANSGREQDSLIGAKISLIAHAVVSVSDVVPAISMVDAEPAIFG